MKQFYDVVIAGAGPIGLFLACELGLRRISVLVLERELSTNSPWKVKPLGMRGLNTLSVEILHQRGLLYKVFDSEERSPSTRFEKTSGFQWGGHYAGLFMNANKFDLDRYKYRINGPALMPGPTYLARLEDLLTGRAKSLGVTILRGEGVTKITAQHDDSVTIESSQNNSFQGEWLVGCDGGRSVVRKAAGFDFVGTEAKFTGYAIKCDLDQPEKLKQGFIHTKTGMYISFGGSLFLIDFDDGAGADRKIELTRDFMQEVFNRVTCMTDIKITTLHLVSAWTDRAKQATKYRKGRVLLAGDAAHIHPPLGSQGLNTGLGDAMNLGWKLAATIHALAADDTAAADKSTSSDQSLALLDTYEAERHPIAAWVLEYTRAQVAVMTPDLYGAGLMQLTRDMIDTVDGTTLFMDRMWGLSQRYLLGSGEAHPLVGCSLPDLELEDGSRLQSMMEGGRGLLVEFGEDEECKEMVGDGKYGDRVGYLAAKAVDRRGLRKFLVRPDGIVAWVVEDNATPDMAALRSALDRWFRI